MNKWISPRTDLAGRVGTGPGPASLPEGFLNNRRFQTRQPILRHVQDMVFAART